MLGTKTIVLTCTIQGELPFSLNLPEGTYPVLRDDEQYPISLTQDQIAVADGPDVLVIGKSDELLKSMGTKWEVAYKRKLQTLVHSEQSREVRINDLLTPTEQQLFEAVQSHLVCSSSTESLVGPEKLKEMAVDYLANASSEDREMLVYDTSVRLTAKSVFPRSGVDHFLDAVNILIRLYMENFKDRFVQEVTESMFSGTVMGGVRHTVLCDGQLVESVRHVGGYTPFVIRGPWWTHPDEDVTKFRSRLASAPTPNPVQLLQVRARSMLLRGAYRSAILEASAAFDLCLLRKIRAGLASKGLTDAEIQARLDEKERYEDRSKELLKEATGKTVPELDNLKWERFRSDRKKRGTIAHSENEPDAKYATDSVENMIEITESIDRLPT